MQASKPRSERIIYDGPPPSLSARWNLPGDRISGAIYYVAEIQCTKFGTQEPDRFKDGRIKMQTLVRVLVTDHSAGFEVNRGGRAMQLAEAGGVGARVAVYIKGADLSQFRGALPGDGRLAIGDVLTVEFTELDDTKRGIHPRKVKKFVITTDDPGAAMTATLEAAYTQQLALDGERENAEKLDSDYASGAPDDFWDGDSDAGGGDGPTTVKELRETAKAMGVLSGQLKDLIQARGITNPRTMSEADVKAVYADLVGG